MKCLALIFLVACTPHVIETNLTGAYLELPDTLEFCDDLRVREKRILARMEEWRQVNPAYTYRYIRHSDCKSPTGAGVIRFQRSDPRMLRENNANAYTALRMYTDYGVIHSATVHIRPKDDNLTILHEIGHAWGWDHVIDLETGEYLPYGHLLSLSATKRDWSGLERWP